MFNWTRFPSISESSKEIVILYEDGETRVGIREALAKAVRQSGYKCRISEWKFSMLDSPAMLKQAVEDTATAEMIVVCARGNSELPEAVKVWTEQWLANKTTSTGIFIGLLDAAFGKGDTGAAILDYLMCAAAEGGFQWQRSYFQFKDFDGEIAAERI